MLHHLLSIRPGLMIGWRGLLDGLGGVELFGLQAEVRRNLVKVMPVQFVPGLQSARAAALIMALAGHRLTFWRNTVRC